MAWSWTRSVREAFRLPPRSGSKPRGGEEFGEEIYDLYLNGLGGSDSNYFDELRTVEGRVRFVRMLDANPLVSAYRNAVVTLGTTAQWWVGERDAPNAEDPREELIRKAMDSLTRDTGGWSRVVAQALLAPIYGASVFEVTYRNEDGTFIWNDFGFRPYFTITEVLIRNGKFVGLHQESSTFREAADLSIESLVLLTWQPEYGPLGRSAFYSSYPSYRRREDMESIGLLGLRRTLNAPAVLESNDGKLQGAAPPIDSSSNDSKIKKRNEQMRELLSRLNEGTQGAMALPPGYKFNLPGGGGSRTFEAVALLQRQDHSALAPVGASHFLLPGGKVGSYALADVNQTMFNMAVDAILDRFGDVINRVEIPRLLALNGFDVEGAPRVAHSSVAEMMSSMTGNSPTAEPTTEPEPKEDDL